MHETQTFHGTSFESFEDAVANAGVPGDNVPRVYSVTLGYSPPAGVVGRAQYLATLTGEGLLQEAGESPVG